MTLRTPTQCLPTLALLARTPALARHVRTLVICPDVPTSKPARPLPFTLTAPPPDPDGLAIAAAVRRAAPRLDALHTFVWDAAERPADDDMWFALRLACPRLQSVGSSIGRDLPPQASHVRRRPHAPPRAPG